MSAWQHATLPLPPNLYLPNFNRGDCAGSDRRAAPGWALRRVSASRKGSTSSRGPPCCRHGSHRRRRVLARMGGDPPAPARRRRRLPRQPPAAARVPGRQRGDPGGARGWGAPSPSLPWWACCARCACCVCCAAARPPCLRFALKRCCRVSFWCRGRQAGQQAASLPVQALLEPSSIPRRARYQAAKQRMLVSFMLPGCLALLQAGHWRCGLSWTDRCRG